MSKVLKWPFSLYVLKLSVPLTAKTSVIKAVQIPSMVKEKFPIIADNSFLLGKAISK